MNSETLPRLTILSSEQGVIERLIERTCSGLQRLQRAEGTPHLVLTGGGTGQRMGELLAGHRAATSVDWSRVNVWWGDERFVSEDAPDRNDAAWMSVLVQQLGVPEEHIFRTPSPTTHPSVVEATAQWEQVLRTSFLPTASNAIVILGVGPDGHVASLFPQAASLRTHCLAVGITQSPKPPAERISFTLRALNHAGSVIVATSGDDVADALSEAWENMRSAAAPTERLPLSMVKGTRSTSWILDRAASSHLRSQA